jgi:hypothetical protein
MCRSFILTGTIPICITGIVIRTRRVRGSTHRYRTIGLPVVNRNRARQRNSGFFAFRDIARAQTSLHAMPPAQSPSRQVARQKSSAGLSIQKSSGDISGQSFEAQIAENTRDLFTEGRDTFRFDTFGDEDFWGGALQLHQAIEGAALGGVGPGITPRAALDLGLKVDGNALHGGQGRLQSDRLDLDSPAGTLALLKANAIVGLTGFFNADGSLKSVGIQCALCHSTVDNSVASGIGHRLDGWANRDLDVGRIIASAPNLTPFATLLGVDVATVKTVLLSCRAGKFDAELALDSKAFNPQQVSHGVVTGTNVSGATLLPNAYGLAGFNQHTSTKRQPSVATNFSVARRDATTAMSSRYGRTPAGICTSHPRSASTASRPIARRIIRTRR